MSELLLLSNRIHVGMDEPKDKSKAWLKTSLTVYNMFTSVPRLVRSSYDISDIIEEDARFGFSTYILEEGTQKPRNYLVHTDASWTPIVIENYLNIEYDGNRMTLILPPDCSYSYEDKRLTLNLTDKHSFNHSNGKVEISV